MIKTYVLIFDYQYLEDKTYTRRVVISDDNHAQCRRKEGQKTEVYVLIINVSCIKSGDI